MKFRYQILAVLVASVTGAAPFKYNNVVDINGAIIRDTMGPAYALAATAMGAGQKEITVRINSIGGNVDEALLWIRMVEDAKKTYGARVTCIVDTQAQSAAAIILESPACDTRLATSRSFMMFHNAAIPGQYPLSEARDMLASLEATNEALGNLVSARLGIPYDSYRKIIRRHRWYMSPREALAAHAIDGLVSPGDIAPPLSR